MFPFEAESIAFTVCSALGIDTSDYSFPYVASWASGKELKELKDSMDTIRLTAADFLEKLETAVAERSVERMTAMEYAEKLIADKERDKTVFDNSQRNLIVNFAYKLDDRAVTEELANNLAAAVVAENTEEINRLMWEAEEKIESLPDGMIGLSEMHEYGYVAVAYEINDGYFNIQTSEDGYDYTLYNKDFTVMDGGIIEVDGYRPVQEMMEEVLAEHGHSVSECGVISTAYLQEQSYRAETQRAEAMKEKLAAEKPAPEANISFYVAECAEFPVMGEFHGNLTLEQALEIYDKIPAERMNGIKSIGFSLEDGSIYSGMFDLMVGGEVQAEVVNHIQHYRESPLVQKAISDMKTLLEKRQASKELEERPNTRQSVREALKNRKKAQEQQPHQEQAKPKKAKKKGEIEL